MKDIKRTSLIAFIIGIILFIIEHLLFKVSTDKVLEQFLIFQFYSFVITFANIILNEKIDKFVTWEEQPKKRLLYGIIGSIIVTMLIIVLLRLFVVLFFYHNTFEDFLNTKPAYYIYSFIILINILIVIHAIHFFKALTEKRVKKHKVIGKTQSAKFESLKNQLDPHFLFNSLNVLTSLIEENPKKAEKFTTKLSKIYRYVLTQKNEDLVLVADELTFANMYMDLLKMRFEDAIIFEIPDQLSNSEYKIIPLSLQLLLENAVKHNTITSTKKLHIKIFEEKEYLVIQNNYNPKSNIGKSTKVGLRNIKERFALVTNSQVIIENNQKTFTIKLPLLIKKTNSMETSNIHNKEEKYYRAKKQVKEMKDFYGSLAAYIIFVPFIIYIWNRSYNDFQWFWFPILGWGFGLFFQGMKAFNRHPFLGNDWEKRKIQEIMDEDDELRF